MTPDRWQKVSRLCREVLERTVSERAAFLDDACAGNEVLRREVESLLAHEAETGELIEGPAAGVVAKVAAEQGNRTHTGFGSGDSGVELIGRNIGVYKILAVLGAGGMGEVYRARDTKLGRDVAIKVLPEAFTSDPERLARFEREARLLAALNHPHIGAIYGFEEAQGVRALILELVEGLTLADVITRMGPRGMPMKEALTIARQIAEALEAAHEKGIIHRDLKPANIKLKGAWGPTPTRDKTAASSVDSPPRVSGDINVKVLDFGLAKAFAGENSGPDLSQVPTVTATELRPGAILGTPAYMSPEQARGEALDKRTDIWAFGCVLYEMLTGRRAFEGHEITDVLARILEREPDFSGLPDTTPAAIRRLLRRSLEKDRKRRLPDIGVAQIEIDEAITSPASEQSLTAPSARGRQHIVWALSAMAVLTIGALAIPATFYFRRAVPEPVVTRLDVVTPATSHPFSFALSPDGRQVVFVANGEKGSQLWLRPLDQVRAQPLAGTEGANYPFWAPDGRALGFFADGKVKRIDLAGGVVQVLADAPVARGGTWSPDGVIVFAPSGADPLMRVAATGGTAVPVTRFGAGQGGHRLPQFLPDGRRFLFLMATGGPDTHGVYVGSLDGGEPTRVTPAETAAEYAPPGYLLLVSQGVLVAYPFDAARATVAGEPIPVAQAVGTNDGVFHSAFSVSAAGVLAHRAGAGSRRQLVWIDRTGKILDGIGSPDENSLAFPDLAPDGQRVAVNRTVQSNVDVWLMDVGRGVPGRFTFDVAIDAGPLWSPDGSQVVFRSSRKGVFDLFEKPASGTADEQPLLVTSQAKSPMDWSRDGRFLLYSTQDPKTASDLWALPMMGERKPFAVLQSNFDEIGGQFSSDGRWLAYASNESGRYEIYIRTFPEAGGKWQVSVAGGVQPRWRRDGQELFYVAPDSRLMAVPIRLAPDTHTLEAGAPVPLFPTRLATGGNIGSTGFLARAQYAVAPDGRFLMNISADEPASPITIVQNWTVGLKK